MKIAQRTLLLLVVVLFPLSILAQERLTEHTLKLSPGKKAPAATIADMSWLAGHWTGPRWAVFRRRFGARLKTA